MVIGGLQKFSLSDFPGKISAIVYTQGCSFRCRYCHNPELVDPSRYGPAIPPARVLDFLASRAGKLQGVVVTGGEPTLQPDLPQFLMAIRQLGFDIKLDTNGSNPDLLAQIIASGLIDYLAMDIKAPIDGYRRVTGVEPAARDIERSIGLVIGSGLPHELRTTYEESLLSAEDLAGIARLARGARLLVLQSFRPTKALDGEMLTRPTPDRASLDRARRAMEAAGVPVLVR